MSANVGIVFKKILNIVYCSPLPVFVLLFNTVQARIWAKNGVFGQKFRLRRLWRRATNFSNGHLAKLRPYRRWCHSMEHLVDPFWSTSARFGQASSKLGSFGRSPEASGDVIVQKTEPIVIVLFKDSSVVLLLLLTLRTVFIP